jgi:hypothetical protein
LARHPGEVEFKFWWENGACTTCSGDPAEVFAGFVAAGVAPEAKLDDLDTPDRAIKLAAQHLARRHGVTVPRVAGCFDRIVTQALAGVVPRGTELIFMFLSGPLSWPARALACTSVTEPLALLEGQDLATLPGRLSVTDALCDARTPLYTHRELGRLLADFAAHLQQNNEPLLRTGHATTGFARSPWLDVQLNKLYPVKIPVVLGGIEETPRCSYDPRYVEKRRIAAPLTAQGLNRRTSPPCPVLEM